MNLNDVQRAYLAIYAAHEAGPRGSIEQMQAIAYCIRNRVRQGWEDGDWMKVIENADQHNAHDPWETFAIETESRSFQHIIRDVDDIYFSRRDWLKDPGPEKMPSLNEAIGNACFWMFLNRPIRPWFQENILSKPQNHRQGASMGVMIFFE